MKTILTTAILAFVFTASAQTISVDSISQKVLFKQVTEIKDQKKDTLFLKAKVWFTSTYFSSKDVIQFEDKDAGVIVGKAFRDIWIETGILPVKMKMFYTIKVSVKDNKFKIEITDIYYESYPDQSNNYTTTRSTAENVITDKAVYKENGKPRKVNLSYREQTISATNSLMADFTAAMQKKATSDSGW